MRRGSVAIRTCIGCGRREKQAALLRLAADAHGEMRLRPAAAPRQGRGGYLHPDEKCIQSFSKRKGRVRSLGRALDRNARQALVAGALEEIRERVGE